MSPIAPALEKADLFWASLPFINEEPKNAMERDRRIFNRIKVSGTAPVLRFFRWSKPSISFGRTSRLTQEETDRFLSEGWALAQRPTGGGKVFHRADLCFSLFWKKGDPTIPWGIAESYRSIHGWVQSSLDELGQSTDFFEAGSCGAYVGDQWCFNKPVCSDLMRAGQKIVGGAQFRSHGFALHQGSIQISPENHARMIAILETRFSHAYSGAVTRFHSEEAV